MIDYGSFENVIRPCENNVSILNFELESLKAVQGTHGHVTFCSRKGTLYRSTIFDMPYSKFNFKLSS